MNCYRCNRNIPDYSLVCPNCGAEMSQRAKTGGQSPFMNMNFPPFGTGSMAWYSILVTVYLFMEAFISAVSGIQYISGFIPEVMKNSEGIMYYCQINGTLKYIDVLYGLWYIGMAVFAVFTRTALAKYRKNAPLFVLLFFSVPTVINCLYSIPLMILVNTESASYFTLVFQVIIQMGFVYANYIYFKKRKTLFVN